MLIFKLSSETYVETFRGLSFWELILTGLAILLLLIYECLYLMIGNKKRKIVVLCWKILSINLLMSWLYHPITMKVKKVYFLIFDCPFKPFNHWFASFCYLKYYLTVIIQFVMILTYAERPQISCMCIQLNLIRTVIIYKRIQ